MKHHSRKFWGKPIIMNKVMVSQSWLFRVRLLLPKRYIQCIHYQLCINGIMGYPNILRLKANETCHTWRTELPVSNLLKTRFCFTQNLQNYVYCNWIFITADMFTFLYIQYITKQFLALHKYDFSLYVSLSFLCDISWMPSPIVCLFFNYFCFLISRKMVGDMH